MTYQDKKEFLKGYLIVREEYQRQLERFQELRTTMDGLKAQILSDMPKSQPISHDRFGTSLSIIEEMEIRNTSLFQKYKQIEDIIQAVPDSMHRELLRLQYLEGYNKLQVSNKLGYAYEYVFELEKKVLNKLEIKL